MWIYSLKFGLALIVFLVFYKAFLERESIHQFKRYYLLTSLIAALIIPLITFTSYVEAPVSSTSGFIASNDFLLNNSTDVKIAPVNYFTNMLWAIYAAGVLVSLFRFLFNLKGMIHKIRINEKVRNENTTHVLLKERVTPHTFFNYIFFNKKQYLSEEIPEEVFWHEETHARQKHSIDVLVVELLLIIFWFNPLVYLFRLAIKLNHEFLADQRVLSKGIKPAVYQDVLLTYSEKKLPVQLANAINYSLIKKRFIIMKKQSDKRTITWKLLMIVPLVAVVIYGFSNKETLQIEAKEVKSPLVKAKNSIVKGEEIAKETLSDPLEEYNRRILHYNTSPETDFVVKVKDMFYLRELFTTLSSKEQEKVIAFKANTPTLDIYLTNDGRFKINENVVTAEEIEDTFKMLSEGELSGAHIFMSTQDVLDYANYAGNGSSGVIPPRETFINLFSDEIVRTPVMNMGETTSLAKIKDLRVRNYASENPKVLKYMYKLQRRLSKYIIRAEGC